MGGGGGADLPSLNPGVSFVNQFQPQADTGAFNQIGKVQQFDDLFSRLGNYAGLLGGTGAQNIANLSDSGQGGRTAGPEASIPAGASQLFREAFGSKGGGDWEGLGLVDQMQRVGETAFDPQKELYGRTLQQLQDQTRAGLEARGLDMTPYGAGTESDAVKNFNIDWQNNQLQREQQGAQTQSVLGGLQNTLAQGSGSMLNQYDQAQKSALDPLNAGLQGVSTAQQGLNLPFQDFIAYLAQATNQNNTVINAYKAQAEAALQNQQMKNQQSQSEMSGIGSGIGSIAGLIGGK